MAAWRKFGLIVLATAFQSVALAQAPVLSNIQTEYPHLQQAVQVAGAPYTSGQVAYGLVGMPIIITGSNFGESGNLVFISYKNGAVDSLVPQLNAPISSWSPNSIIAAIPPGAKSGLVKVVNSNGTSNGQPIMVMLGVYSAACTVLPEAQPLQILTSELDNGTVNDSYSLTLQATGGSTPYSWSLATGSTLPTGLTLNSSGTITGTPTTATDPVNITLKASDASTPQQVDSATLSIQIAAQPSGSPTAPLYSFSIQDSGGNEGYDAAGNLTNAVDEVNGTWTFNYDTLNRLANAAGSQTTISYPNLCWQYDTFGNRLLQYSASAPFASGNGGPNSCTISGTVGPTSGGSYVNGTNQLSSTSQTVTAGQTLSYDSSGNMQNDGYNKYAYDGDGRLCASENLLTGAIEQYIYDAEGNRVAKGPVNLVTIGGVPTLSCDTTANGFVAHTVYVVGQAGEQLSELSWNTTTSAWQVVHTNAFGAGQPIATYDADLSGSPTAGWLYFHMSDWLGTRRQQTDYAGNPCMNFVGLPYGDGLTPVSIPGTSCGDATEHHFTGKERDSESGNDYFGARYYASTMGRFLSADPSGLLYADPTNPQSFNLYNYGLNNPLVNIDPNGLDCIHVNVDTGVFEGFESGDCDNSTEEKANSGQYVDGTVTSITTSNGTTDPADASGIVRGYSGTNDDTGALISGTFAAPMDSPLQPVPQIDPDEQRIDSLVQGVATDTASTPWLCNASVSVRGQIPKTPFAVGLSADKNGVQPSARAKLGENADGLQVNLTTNGKKVGYQFSAPIVGTPFRGTLSTGNNQATVGVSRNLPFGGNTLSASGSLTFGYLGDAHCRN